MHENVLIVDDSAFMRTMLKDILKERFKNIHEAGDGRQAVEMYGRIKPDLVTMDMIMPSLNGIDAVREILKTDKDARILMVSAMGQQQLVDEALDAGARDFIIKPFQPDKVAETVGRVLGA